MSADFDTLKRGMEQRVVLRQLNELIESLRAETWLSADDTGPLIINQDSNGKFIGLDVAVLAETMASGGLMARDYNYYHALNYGTSPWDKIYYSSAVVPIASSTSTPQLVPIASGGGDVCVTPFVTMSGGDVSDIAFELVTPSAVATERVVLGIYENVADTTLYPAALLAQGTEFNVNTSPAGLCVSAITATLLPGALYWLAIFSNSNAVGGTAAISTILPDQLFPILGMGSVAWTLPGLGAGGGFGGLVSTYGTLGITYSATLPDPFPLGMVPGNLGSGSYAPLIGVAFNT